MRTGNVSLVLDQVIKANTEGRHLVPFLKGAPGTAKSSLVLAAAQRAGIDFQDVRLSVREPVDLIGAMQVKNGKTVYAPPAWLPTEGRGILFFDEYAQAMLAMMNAAGQLLYERRIGDYNLPAGWVIVLASNRKQDRAGTSTVPQQINNRCIHINVDVRYDDWLSDYAVPAGIDWRVMHFLDQRQELMSKPSPDAEAFPSLRTWEYVSNILTMDLPTQVVEEMIMGTVGEGAGAEFIRSLRVADSIPPWRKVFTEPGNCPVPENVAALYALMSVLAINATTKNMTALTTYLKRCPPEMSAVCMHTLGRAQPGLKETKAYTDWALSNHIKPATPANPF